MPDWKRNFIFIWISQFCSLTGFSLALPFAPFFIQNLGITDPDAVKFWSALSVSSPPVGMAIMAPIWGYLADRYGRKMMMLRANFSAMIILFGMSLSPNVMVFVILRFLQGAFTGTVTAAMTFVSSSTPSSKQGKALGFLSVAVYSGSMVGPILGGFLAEIIGYRNSFIASGFLLMMAALLILIPVQENFVRPISARKMKPGEKSNWLEALGPGLPILFLMMFLAAAQIFDAPIWPLYVQKIHGRLEGAAKWTGVLNGVAAIGSISAGYWFGRIADRLSPQKIGPKLVFFAGIFMAIIGFFPSFGTIFPARFLLAFCAAGLDPILQMWISHVTPESKKGTIFGWAVTAKSVGWFISPLISGSIAVGFGIPAMYLFGLIQFWILIPIIKIVSNRVLLLQEENNGRVVTI